MSSPPPHYIVENHSTLEPAQHSTLEPVYDSPDQPLKPDDGAQAHYAPGDTGISAKEAIANGDTSPWSEEQSGRRSGFMQRRVCGMRMRIVIVLAGTLVLLVVVGAVVGGVVGSRKSKEDPPTEALSNGTTTNSTGTQSGPQSLEELINSTTEYPVPREPNQRWRFRSLYWYHIFYWVVQNSPPELNMTGTTQYADASRYILSHSHLQTKNGSLPAFKLWSPGDSAVLYDIQFLAVPTAISEQFVKPENYTKEAPGLYFDMMLYWICFTSFDEVHRTRLSLVKEEWESYANLSPKARKSAVLNITQAPRHINPDLQLWYVASSLYKRLADYNLTEEQVLSGMEPLYLFNYRTGHSLALGYNEEETEDSSLKRSFFRPVMKLFDTKRPNLRIANVSTIDFYNSGPQAMDFNTCIDGNPC